LRAGACPAGSNEWRYRSAAASAWAGQHGSGDAYPAHGTSPHGRRFRPSPLLVLGVATFVLWLALRGPSSGRGGVVAPVHVPQSVVSLACRRCNRVVDVPRERLTRQLFCPRCGATLPRDA
jgi:hypothetical protein